MSAYIETLNYYNDKRTHGPAGPAVLYTDDGDITLPMRWVVCPVCDGEGKHVNPAIDAGGISREDLDPDFVENYIGGVYDVCCSHCQGRTTIQEVDWDSLTSEQADAYRAQLDELDKMRACEIAERAMGA